MREILNVSERNRYYYRVRCDICVRCGVAQATSGRLCRDCQSERRNAQKLKGAVKTACPVCGRQKAVNARFCVRCAAKKAAEKRRKSKRSVL